ncbi:GSCOCG00000433001-RA-CDS [Cotesia congregata]|uniref:Similar to Ncapd3: Condensin-2 complex subunit D3 (Mus musculus) n=1 Tax=Cotesia congregata TaxID=51543 RepID=A0A8J2HA77_COTCN|nr:GSCOCG00000433001-RA-CDS [Cotesia congregata]CAG5088039.1 Similar to Ncapd3: Condensin-2 complex subunit D3 (Mus musculus) [Cotesia congregata]
MEPLRIFEKFKLDNLDKSWTESVWNNQFILINKIPGDYALFAESEDMEILLKDTSIVLKTWIDTNKNESSNSDQSEVSWQTLCALTVDPRALLALLGYLIKTGQGMDADEDSRQACLHATSLYLTLLAIPGSSAYQIFHENLYYSVVKSLELSQHLMPVVKKSVKNLDLESLYIQDEEPSRLLQTEKITLTKSLNVIMYNMILMLNSWHMRDYVRSLEQTVDSLIEVTKLGTEVSDFKSPKKVSEGSVVSLVHNAYAALGQLCDPRHGHVEVTIKLIAKNILPHMLYNYTRIPLRSLTVVRDTAIYFLKTLLLKHQKNAETGVMILIQHLMVNCPERLETRQKQASVIVKLINICCNTFYAKMIKDLVLFAHNNKIPCRIFAQEIIGRFLLDPMKDEQNSERAAATSKYKCILFGTVLSRCTDVSSMVRGRAMATLVEYTNTSNNPFVINLFSFSDLSQRQLPTLETLLEGFDSDTVDSLLPDVNNFISMLKTRAEDERALVRRSSMQIFQNAVLNSPDLLDTVVPVVSEHCRDPAMIVRKFAIQVLTTLLESYPNHETLYKVWVKAVVPQVFDIEVKVQEKVLETMEALIIERVDKLKKNDSLPWKIIDELTVMKMRKHLTRACDAWLHSEIITNSTIRKIQSYINTEHNIAAWTLLSAIAENETIPGMREYFENYQEILKGQGFFEFLAMEVLRCCWPTFDSNFLEKLSENIYQSLKKATINPVLISISMDILYGILKHLNSGDSQIESKMTDLMQSSEKIIELIMNQDIKHTPVDVNNYTKAICTLGHASLFSTNAIRLNCIRTLQGMLIEWERMPLSLQNARELQATAIVALGQQAMREEKIAHEMMPIFGQLLSAGVNSNARINQRDADADAAVRVNAAKALADVCTRFTALVEPYLPDMCVSMKGDNKTVREAIVVIFIQLLVEDYIKVKGSFFFHILTMLSDPDDTIREMTVFLIKERLLVKNKTLISQQFLEGIFHYNDYELDEKYLERKMGSAERKALTLAGNINASKRRIIYDFMLEHLDLPGKLKLLIRLTTQVLHRALSDKINANDEKGRCVLQDTFYIIASDQLQPSSCTSKHNDDDADDSTVTSSSNTGASHAGNVIADGIKKHGLNHLLPTMIKLKIKLKKLNGKSKLVEDISKSIARIGTEFNKEQLSSLYNEWPEIEKEMEFDIRRYGKKGVDESAEQEFTSQAGEAVHPLLDNNRIPRIVIEKLTSLSCNDEETENLICDEAVEARKNKNTSVVAITNLEAMSKVSSPKKRDNKYRRI